MEIIIPCAGKSSRYPNLIPKYLLPMKDGRLMFEHAADKFFKKRLKVNFIILKQHEKKYNVSSILRNKFDSYKNYKIHILNKVTSGPAETVFSIAKKLSGPIYIQDCDSFFDSKIKIGNFVNVIDINNYPQITNVAGKSFALINEQGILNNIIEKEIVSNFVCCGGYSFNDAKKFCEIYKKIGKKNKEIYVSHIIKNLLKNEVFDTILSSNYFDLGTITEYDNYMKQNRTFIINLYSIFDNINKWYLKKEINFDKNKILKIINYQKKFNNKVIFLSHLSKEFCNLHTKNLKEMGLKNFTIIENTPLTPKFFLSNQSEQLINEQPITNFADNLKI